ncbi:MAG TPA: hypothetical protein DEP05_06210 [Betaproteobacteria bacterium]|nr:hypothetical protein [Betaproteobacteria bacterium]
MAARLNFAQQSAVDEESHCLVAACPGSGKTTVLVEKAASILSKTPESRIVVATFTRDAANEMRKRIVSRVGEEMSERISTNTFHGLAFRQLRKSKKIKGGASILTEAEQLSFASRAAAVAGIDISREEAMRVIEETRITLAGSGANDEAARLVAAYEDLVKRNRSIDFQDLMRMAVIGMRNGGSPPLKCTHLFITGFCFTITTVLFPVRL